MLHAHARVFTFLFALTLSLSACRGGARSQQPPPAPQPSTGSGRPAYVEEGNRQKRPELPPDTPLDEAARGATAEEVVAALADDLVAQLEDEEEGEQAEAQKKPRLGVLDFAAEDGSQKELAASLADALQDELVASKRFQVVEKRKVGELEQNREQEGGAGHDERTAAALGRRLGTDLVCQGRLHLKDDRCVVVCQVVDSSRDLVRASARGEIRLDIYGGESEPASSAPVASTGAARPTTAQAQEQRFSAIAGMLGRQARAQGLAPPPRQEQERLKARVAEFLRRRATPAPRGQRPKPRQPPKPQQPGPRRGR